MPTFLSSLTSTYRNKHRTWQWLRREREGHPPAHYRSKHHFEINHEYLVQTLKERHEKDVLQAFTSLLTSEDKALLKQVKVTADLTLQEQFHQEAEKWKHDTMHWSSVTKMIAHPSYLRIIGLGSKLKEGKIEKLILEELKNEPDYWFDALVAITGEDPVQKQDDFDTAVEAWLAWGRQKGIINHEDDNARRTTE